MTKVKENGTTKEAVQELTKGQELTLGEAYGVSRSIFELSASVPSMKGKIVFALTKNESLLEKLLVDTDKRQGEIIKKYVKLNKDGSFELTQPTEEEVEKGARQEYIYKDEKDKIEAAKEVQNLMEEMVTIEFHKIWMNDFENLDIVPSRNTNIGVFIKYLVSEVRDLQMVQ